MEWFYAAEDGKRGPVSDEQLEELHRAGSISPATLVWHTGLVTWQPLREVRASWSPKALCVECHREFAEDAMLRFEGRRVCAGCKPVLLQRVAEGGALPWPTESLLRDDRLLVLRTGTPLPDRCLLCNAPADGRRISQRFRLKGAILRHMVLELPVCGAHRQGRRWWVSRASWFMVPGVVMISVAFGLDVKRSVVGLCVGFLLGELIGPPTVVEHVKTQGDFIWLKGVSLHWLEGLPEWHVRAQ